jgi:biotin synthase
MSLAPDLERKAFAAGSGPIRHDWTRPEVRALLEMPFPELLFVAQRLQRLYFYPGEVEI